MRYSTKYSLILILLIISMFGLTTAQEEMGGTYSKQGAEYMDAGLIVNTLVYDTVKVDEDMTVYMTAYEQSGKTLDNTDVDCRLGIVSPDGSRLYLINNTNFTFAGDGDIFVATIPGTFLNETGSFLLNWDCQNVLKGGYFNSHIEVTKSGLIPKPTKFASYVVMLLLIVVLMFFMSKKHRETDFEEAKNSIVEGHKNAGETMVRGIITALFKNSFIWLYFTGWLLVLVMREILYEFGNATIYSYFTIMANIYSLGLVLLTIYMVGYLLSYMRNIFSILTDNSWGVGK